MKLHLFQNVGLQCCTTVQKKRPIYINTKIFNFVDSTLHRIGEKLLETEFFSSQIMDYDRNLAKNIAFFRPKNIYDSCNTATVQMLSIKNQRLRHIFHNIYLPFRFSHFFFVFSFFFTFLSFFSLILSSSLVSILFQPFFTIFPIIWVNFLVGDHNPSHKSAVKTSYNIN